MIFTTIDVIVRRTLLENGFPLHWYAEYLFHSSTCLRELTIDTLKVINTKSLPVADDGSVDLPDDFSDDVMLSYATGALMYPIPHKDNINPLRLHNSETGAFESQPTTTAVGQGTDLFFPFIGRTWYWNVSDYGEPTGRVFGAGGGNPNGYTVVKERRQIQLYGCTGGSVILQYISDGQSVDSASMVDVLAFATIQAYIDWKRSPSRDNEFSPEGRKYYNTKRKLRGRLNGLTDEDIKNTIRRNFHAAMKN